ncbi:hemophore [Mycolicibacterium elephantis]|uniref:hemophore n=1 Tax=Mycolicibacterium elephantis TaxID=81858 RepID=UPI003A8918FE
MRPTHRVLRRSLTAVFAATAVGGAVAAGLTVPVAPSATAASDPCAASEVAKTIGSVATSIGDYLDEHPQTNQALTTISQQQAGPQSLGTVKAYFDANPKVAKEMQQLQQPLASLSSRCKLPLTLPQMMGLLQQAQQSVQQPQASLPGALPTAHNAGLPETSAAVRSPAASSVTPGSGRVPTAPIAGLP